jgi:hypothetical protein
MTYDIVGFTFYSNAHMFRYAAGITLYVPAKCVVTKERNMPYLSVPRKILDAFHKKEISYELMEELYYDTVLRHYDPNEIIEDIHKRFGIPIVICGVFRNPMEDHRSVFAKWINDNTRYNALEVSEQSELFGNNAEGILNGHIIKT